MPTHVLFKYSDDEPRDAEGRWTSDGTVAVQGHGDVKVSAGDKVFTNTSAPGTTYIQHQDGSHTTYYSAGDTSQTGASSSILPGNPSSFPAGHNYQPFTYTATNNSAGLTSYDGHVITLPGGKDITLAVGDRAFTDGISGSWVAHADGTVTGYYYDGNEYPSSSTLADLQAAPLNTEIIPNLAAPKGAIEYTTPLGHWAVNLMPGDRVFQDPNTVWVVRSDGSVTGYDEQETWKSINTLDQLLHDPDVKEITPGAAHATSGQVATLQWGHTIAVESGDQLWRNPANGTVYQIHANGTVNLWPKGSTESKLRAADSKSALAAVQAAKDGKYQSLNHLITTGTPSVVTSTISGTGPTYKLPGGQVVALQPGDVIARGGSGNVYQIHTDGSVHLFVGDGTGKLRSADSKSAQGYVAALAAGKYEILHSASTESTPTEAPVTPTPESTQASMQMPDGTDIEIDTGVGDKIYDSPEAYYVASGKFGSVVTYPKSGIARSMSVMTPSNLAHLAANPSTVFHDITDQVLATHATLPPYSPIAISAGPPPAPTPAPVPVSTPAPVAPLPAPSSSPSYTTPTGGHIDLSPGDKVYDAGDGDYVVTHDDGSAQMFWNSDKTLTTITNPELYMGNQVAGVQSAPVPVAAPVTPTEPSAPVNEPDSAAEQAYTDAHGHEAAADGGAIVMASMPGNNGPIQYQLHAGDMIFATQPTIPGGLPNHYVVNVQNNTAILHRTDGTIDGVTGGGHGSVYLANALDKVNEGTWKAITNDVWLHSQVEDSPSTTVPPPPTPVIPPTPAPPAVIPPPAVVPPPPPGPKLASDLVPGDKYQDSFGTTHEIASVNPVATSSLGTLIHIHNTDGSQDIFKQDGKVAPPPYIPQPGDELRGPDGRWISNGVITLPGGQTIDVKAGDAVYQSTGTIDPAIFYVEHADGTTDLYDKGGHLAGHLEFPPHNNSAVAFVYTADNNKALAPATPSPTPTGPQTFTLGPHTITVYPGDHIYALKDNAAVPGQNHLWVDHGGGVGEFFYPEGSTGPSNTSGIAISPDFADVTDQYAPGLNGAPATTEPSAFPPGTVAPPGATIGPTGEMSMDVPNPVGTVTIQPGEKVYADTTTAGPNHSIFVVHNDGTVTGYQQNNGQEFIADAFTPSSLALSSSHTEITNTAGAPLPSPVIDEPQVTETILPPDLPSATPTPPPKPSIAFAKTTTGVKTGYMASAKHLAIAVLGKDYAAGSAKYSAPSINNAWNGQGNKGKEILVYIKNPEGGTGYSSNIGHVRISLFANGTYAVKASSGNVAYPVTGPHFADLAVKMSNAAEAQGYVLKGTQTTPVVPPPQIAAQPAHTPASTQTGAPQPATVIPPTVQQAKIGSMPPAVAQALNAIAHKGEEVPETPAPVVPPPPTVSPFPTLTLATGHVVPYQPGDVAYNNISPNFQNSVVFHYGDNPGETNGGNVPHTTYSDGKDSYPKESSTSNTALKALAEHPEFFQAVPVGNDPITKAPTQPVSSSDSEGKPDWWWPGGPNPGSGASQWGYFEGTPEDGLRQDITQGSKYMKDNNLAIEQHAPVPGGAPGHMTQTQYSKINSYTGSLYSSVNDAGTGLWANGVVSAGATSAINGGLAHGTFPSPGVILFRETGLMPTKFPVDPAMPSVTSKSHAQEAIGSTYVHRGFVSSSVGKEGHSVAGHGISLKLHVNPGVHGLFVKDVGPSHENEVLLEANTEWTVNKVESIGGHLFMDVTVDPPGTHTSTSTE